MLMIFINGDFMDELFKDAELDKKTIAFAKKYASKPAITFANDKKKC